MIKRFKASCSRFSHQFKRGLRYALIFVVIGGVMGAIYGVFGGILVSPIIFSITITGIFVVANFILALIFGVLNFVPVLIGKGSIAVGRYFALSSAFFVTYILFFILLKLSGITPF